MRAARAAELVAAGAGVIVLPPEPPLTFHDGGDRRVELEWISDQIDQKVKLIVLQAAIFAAATYQWAFHITSIYRSPAEDRALGGSGVHTAWRAVDVRTKDQAPASVSVVAAYVNGLWLYDPMRPHFVVCYTAEHGSGPHAHFQSHPFTTPRIPTRAA